MFDRIICPDAAYEQLKKSGLMDRILNEPVKSVLRDSLLYSSLMDNLVEVKKKLISGQLNTEKISMYKDLLACENEFYSNDLMMASDFEPFLKKHPAYLGHIALGEDVLKYEKFGFGDRKSLEEAVTSFCVGERHEFGCFNEDWVWRKNGFKNEISRNMHGDLFVSQMDSSGKDYLNESLFGDVRIFDSMRKADSLGFGAYQDWSEFLVSLLKYSEKVGMSGIREIVNWEDTLEEIGGGRGGNYTEAFGGLSGTEFTAHLLMDRPLICDGEELKSLPFLVSNRDSYAIPFFQDGKLLYLRKDESGDIKLNIRPFEKDSFSKIVEYGPEDLPNAMRATLKYFARSREMIPAIMNEFNKK